MINYYQPLLFPFLTYKPYKLNKHLRQLYYYSWEDGLWDLLEKKNVPVGSTILIPDFYCMDVIDNIISHGYKPILYPLNDNFQIHEQEFITIIDTVAPNVILLFHACGISNCLLSEKKWLNHLSDSTILIEDCVHRLVAPEDITFIHPQHVIMDSLRKDSPLPGSFMYEQERMLNFPQTTHLFSSYTLHSILLYVYFRFALVLSLFLQLPALTKYAHEIILKAHDNIIGDSFFSHRGIPGIPYIHRFLNFSKIKRIKEQQTALYISLTKKLPAPFYQINIPPEDYKHLHVFPVGIHLPADSCRKLEQYLHHHGIIVWCKFPDSPWSKKNAVLFLPLGFHITKKHIQLTLHLLLQYNNF
jgi:hypothetical protein